MKTAIEWLVEQIEKDSDVIFYERNLHPFEEYVKQAKAMEKEQIIDAFREGGVKYSAGVYPEQYYNKTFKSK